MDEVLMIILIIASVIIVVLLYITLSKGSLRKGSRKIRFQCASCKKYHDVAFVPGVPQAGDVTKLLHENLRQVPLWNSRVRLHRNTLDSLELLSRGPPNCP